MELHKLQLFKMQNQGETSKQMGYRQVADNRIYQDASNYQNLGATTLLTQPIGQEVRVTVPENAPHGSQQYIGAERAQGPVQNQGAGYTFDSRNIEGAQKPITEQVPSQFREKFIQKYMDLMKRYYDQKGKQLDNVQAAVKHAQEKEVELLKCSRSIQDYTQNCRSCLVSLYERIKSQAQPSCAQFLQLQKALQKYIPALQHIADTYHRCITELEQRELNLTLTQKEEDAIKDTKSKYQANLNKINSIMYDVQRNPQDFAEPQVFLEKFNQFNDYLRWCQSSTQVAHFYSQQTKQFPMDAAQTVLGKRLIPQTMSQNICSDMSHQHQRRTQQYHFEQMKRQKYGDARDHPNNPSTLASTHYTSSDSQMNRGSYQPSYPQGQPSQRVSNYLNKHSISQQQDYPIQQSGQNQQSYPHSAQSQGHSMSAYSYQHQVQQQLSQEINKVKQKPQLKLSGLLENLKQYQDNIKTEVINLSEYKVDLPLLDKEITSIQRSKEKRDRVGFISSQVVANVSCNFNNLIRDDSLQTKQLASQAYLYKKFFVSYNDALIQREASSGEQEETYFPPGEEAKLLGQEFSQKVKCLLQRVHQKMLNIDHFEKDAQLNLKVFIVKWESESVKKTLALFIDCTQRKTLVTEIRMLNKLISDTEQKKDIVQEVDIDNVEQLFDSDFFESHLSPDQQTA